jgi:hypothetical protein
MKHSNFPKGWNEERVRRVLEHYEKQGYKELANDGDCSPCEQRERV